MANVAFPTQLSTTVTNISGGTRFFAYLNRHGKELANGASHVEHGDLVAKFSGTRVHDRMMRDAITADLQNSRVRIDQTPRAIDAAAGGTPKAAVINASDAFAVESLDYTG